MGIPKEQLRQIIAENDIKEVGDIYTLFKESFKDLLQELLEAEMEASIGYAKNIALREMSIPEQNIFTDKQSGKDFNRPLRPLPENYHVPGSSQNIRKSPVSATGLFAEMLYFSQANPTEKFPSRGIENKRFLWYHASYQKQGIFCRNVRICVS